MNNATKTIPRILRDNICTGFNALNLMIAVALAAVGAWRNLLFIFIILINTTVSIVQEIRAKRQIERLTLLLAVAVMRGGKEQRIRPEELRKGDTPVLAAGNAVCTDCIWQEGRPEVNEAILTGESESVVKLAGDRLLSGSSIVAGRGLAKAECGADACFTAKMVDEVKKAKGSGSELLSSMKKATKFTGFLIVPLSVLLFAQAVFLRGTPVDAAVVATSAGFWGCCRRGWCCLSASALRKLHSLENLAHCDVVCLDKTGTLTEGSLEVESVYPDLDEREFQSLMATYLVHTDDNNSTYRALNEHFSRAGPYEVTAAIPFSSERNLKQQNYPAELIDIYVVADNCIDCTAEIAHAHGARVFERHDRSCVGKGFALSYLLRRIKWEYDGYLVFDADNVVDRNYFREINKTFSAGYDIVTSYRNSKNYGDNWISAGYGLWFLREAQYLNRPRALLGASCGVSGTGFLFSHRILEQCGGWNFFLLTEDIEFTAYNIVHGEKLGYCPAAVFYDEQPTGFRQSVRQRMRWVRGYLQVLRRYGWKLLKGCFRGSFSCFDMLMNIAPAAVLAWVSVFVNLTAAALRFANGADVLAVLLSVGQSLLKLCLTVFLLGLITTISEWKQIF